MLSPDLLKGSLRTIILKLLSDEPSLYGYEITQKVEALSDGNIKLSFGALYPILHKLEIENLLKSEKKHFGQRVRIYYSLTARGRKASRDRLQEFKQYIQVMQAILQPTNG